TRTHTHARASTHTHTHTRTHTHRRLPYLEDNLLLSECMLILLEYFPLSILAVSFPPSSLSLITSLALKENALHTYTWCICFFLTRFLSLSLCLSLSQTITAA